MRADALIRNRFQLEPNTLTIERYAQLYNEAMYLTGYELKNQAKMLLTLIKGNSD